MSLQVENDSAHVVHDFCNIPCNIHLCGISLAEKTVEFSEKQ
jgi:hypothetical protein